MEKDAKTICDKLYTTKLQLLILKTINAIPLNEEGEKWYRNTLDNINELENELIKLKTK